MANLRRGDLFHVIQRFDTAGEMVDFADALLRHGLVSALDTFLVVEMRPGYALIAPLPSVSATSGGLGGGNEPPSLSSKTGTDLNCTAQVTDLWSNGGTPFKGRA